MYSYIVRASGPADACYASCIAETTRLSAIARGAGIGGRPVSIIEERIVSGNAVLAITDQHQWSGFCFINSYDNGRTVSHSGLIVHPQYRGKGLSLQIKSKIIQLTQEKYPGASMISITTTASVLKLNHANGFAPVLFRDLTKDPAFWKGCEGCIHHDLLASQNYQHCFCTAMKKINV